eukprot:732801-Prymnesium_polylepis.1
MRLRSHTPQATGEFTLAADLRIPRCVHVRHHRSLAGGAVRLRSSHCQRSSAAPSRRQTLHAAYSACLARFFHSGAVSRIFARVQEL